MTDIADRIRALAPPAEDADWAEVVRSVGRHRRLRRRAALVAVTAAIAVVAALGAIERTGRGRVDLVDRALAAVSGGPVLHVVLSANTEDIRFGPSGVPRWSYSIVDLSTGAERPIQSRFEMWYDPGRRLTHAAEAIDRLPVRDSLDRKRSRTYGRIDPALSAFFTGYKAALAKGRAVLQGEDVIDGHRIEWLWFPLTRKPVPLNFGSEVGVNPRTGEALFYRAWCPKCPQPAGPTYRVETLAGVPRNQASFTSKVRHAPHAAYGDGGGHTIALRDANRLMKSTAPWAGRSVAGIPFSLVQYRWSSRNTGLPPTTANSVNRGKGLVFLYGVRLQPDGRHYHPIPGSPSFAITVTPDAPFGPGNFFAYGLEQAQTVAGGPVPEYDEVALSHEFDTWDVQFKKDGFYVEITAPTRALALNVARAIQPLP